MNLSEDFVKKTLEQLLEKLGIVFDEILVQPGEDGFKVDIDSEADSGVLIGYHGEHLNALQQLLTLMCYKEAGEWQRILVDVEGYRFSQQEKIEDMALMAAKRVRFLQDPVALSPMSSYERRLVHMVLAEEPGVVTESDGEGRYRRVVIYPES